MIRVISFLKIEFGMSKTIIKMLKSIPEVVKILNTTGETDIIIELEGDSPEALSEVYFEKIDPIPGMKEIHSHYVLSVWEK